MRSINCSLAAAFRVSLFVYMRLYSVGYVSKYGVGYERGGFRSQLTLAGPSGWGNTRVFRKRI